MRKGTTKTSYVTPDAHGPTLVQKGKLLIIQRKKILKVLDHASSKIKMSKGTSTHASRQVQHQEEDLIDIQYLKYCAEEHYRKIHISNRGVVGLINILSIHLT